MTLYAILQKPIGRVIGWKLPDAISNRSPLQLPRHPELFTKQDDPSKFEERVTASQQQASDCTLKPLHTGPCNVWPRLTCGKDPADSRN